MHHLQLLHHVAKLGMIPAQKIAFLENPQHIWKATLIVKGKKYPAWRVQYNNARGPYKGGIRFHPGVTEEEIISLAFWMTLKTAVADIPFGGAKGAVQVDPKALSPPELEELSRAYVRAFYKHLGPEKDIPAPDVYTNAQVMAWMLDEYEKLTGKKSPAFITGKPLELGGSRVRDIATALGGVYVLEEAVQKLRLKDKRVCIQGFGNAGMNMAKLLAERGFRIVGVSDSQGGIYDERGLGVDKVVEVKEERGSVVHYGKGKKISNEELLTSDCSILIPSALGGVITKQNAPHIRAQLIVELANGPTTPEADAVLHQQGKVVIPDILANSGGVTVSYFEWVQNRRGESWDEETVKKRLKEKMGTAFDPLWKSYREGNYNLRTVAYLEAIRRVLKQQNSTYL